MQKIICFGEALIDFLSDKTLNKKQLVEKFSKYPGGAPANVAVAAAKLGGNSYFSGMLGDDSFGQFLLESMQAEEVNTDYVRFTASAKTGLAFVSLDDKGERSFEFYRPPSADLLFKKTDFDEAWFNGEGIFHFCSNSLTEEDIKQTTLHGINLAVSSNWLVSFDVNIRQSLWLESANISKEINAFLPYVDIIKMSKNEIDFLAKGYPLDEYIENILNGKPNLLIVTDGEHPMQWFTKVASGSIKPCQITTVDATAAGDAFIGGLLYQFTQQNLSKNNWIEWLEKLNNIEDSIRYASYCGAHAASLLGAFPSLPNQSSLTQFRNRLDRCIL